jgi:hypothetical protein
MSEEHEPATMPGMVHDLARSIVGSLPPTFLLLVIINVVFIGLVMWFLNSQLKQRTDLVNTLVAKCMDIALHAPAPEHH